MASGRKANCPRYEWKKWFYNDSLFLPQVIWFLLLLSMLAFLDGFTNFVWLVPPFGAMLSILILLPESPIAQPFPVILGSTVGAGIGTLFSLFARGPPYAVLASLITLVVIWALRIYHPPVAALAMYPLLLSSGIYFPLVVVLPFTVLAVASCALLSRLFKKNWRPCPLALQSH